MHLNFFRAPSSSRRPHLIKARLLRINMLSMALALLLVLATMLLYQYFAARDELLLQLETQASIIEENSAPALIFADAHAAEEVLASLHASPSIVQAALLLPDGTLFAGYPAKPAVYHYAANGTGSHFGLDRLTLYRDVRLGGKYLGKLFVETKLDRVYSSMRFFAGAITFSILVALGLSLFLHSRLTDSIVRPITHLAELTRLVSHKQDYTLHANIDTQDEIGDLARGFNNMLEQIQTRDKQLEVERETHLQNIVDAMPVALLVKDSQSRFVLMNKACEELFNISFSLLKGTDGSQHYPPDQMAEFLARDRMAFQAKKVVDVEEVVWNEKRKENSECRTIKKPIFDAQGNPHYLIEVIIDITERKHAEQALRLAKETAEASLVRAMDAERRIIDISEETLQRIGRELHDDIGQQLTGIALLSETLFQTLTKNGRMEANSASTITSYLKEAVSHVRHMAHGLYPANLKEDGLDTMLKELTNSVADAYRIKCTFQNHGGWQTNNQNICINLFRIAQEAISNAAKHGKATLIALMLRKTPDAIVFDISDNGCGIKENEKSGLGMHTMRYRANLMNATLQIIGRTGKDSGTSIVISLPIQYS